MEPLERELGPWKYRITFSKAGPTFLELIEAPPCGPWEAGTGPDHLGYWTDDLEQDMARLDESGLPLDFDGREYGRPFTYHRSAQLGTRIELVDASVRPGFLKLWGGTDDGAQGR